MFAAKTGASVGDATAGLGEVALAFPVGVAPLAEGSRGDQSTRREGASSSTRPTRTCGTPRSFTRVWRFECSFLPKFSIHIETKYEDNKGSNGNVSIHHHHHHHLHHHQHHHPRHKRAHHRPPITNTVHHHPPCPPPPPTTTTNITITSATITITSATITITSATTTTTPPSPTKHHPLPGKT
ncbi:hypothetical protein CRUP_000418 [Coryphaenoides rupestris]|nr:hypothetical protein CRUP_000418 [Coryphaenoides rupestris]